MKSKLLMFIATLVAGASVSVTQAQTDVTSQYIPNADFNSDYHYAANSTGELKTGTESKLAVAGWNTFSGINSCSGVFEYGTQAVFNTSTVPLAGPENTTGGCLVLSSGWGESIGYTTDEVNLPAGKYELKYVVQNRNSYGIGSNRFGFVPTSGTAVYGTKTTFAEEVWETGSVSFTLPEDAAGAISVGFIAIGGTGSGNSAKLCLDHVQLLYYGADKESLSDKITEAQALAGDDNGEAAQAFHVVIASAQDIVNNTNATQAEVNEAIAELAYAMLVYRGADASDENPADFTSEIVNPGFNENLNGWNNLNISRVTNDSFTLKEGAAYAERWSNSVFNSDTRMEQNVTNLPNGKYKVIVAAGFGYTGGYLYANNERTAFTNDNIDRDYEVLCNVTDGTLILGVEALVAELTGSGDCYFRFDNFRLQYLGIDLADFQDELTLLIDIAESADYTDADFLGSIRTDLTAAISAAKTTLAGSPTLDDLIDAINELKLNLDHANASIAVYAEFKTVIEDATAYLNDVTTPSQEAKDAFQAAITEALNTYEAAENESFETEIEALKAAQLVYTFAQPTPVDVTMLLVNPSFEEGTIGWTLDRNTTGNLDYGIKTDQNAQDGENVINIWAPQVNWIDLHQSVTLPKGQYKLTAALRTSVAATNQRIYVTLDGETHDSDFITFDPTIEGGWTSIDAWNNLEVTFFVNDDNTVVRFGAASNGKNIDGNQEGWFQADNFRLSYLSDGIIETIGNQINVAGNVIAGDLNDVLTVNVTSVIFANGASVSGTIEPQNNNTIFYGLPSGANLATGKGINAEDAGTIVLTGGAFNAPTGFDVTSVNYNREFNANDLVVNANSGNGWQSIILPYDVTEITASQNGETINLVPFEAWDSDTNDRPFWLYEVNPAGTDGSDAFIAADAIKANTVYLISMPNDPANLGAAYNISGEVTFTGSAITATNLSSQETTAGYTLNPNFNGMVSGVYALNAEGSLWASNQTIESFYGYATLADGSTPQSLPIFGGDDVTSIREVLSGVTTDKGAILITTDNGVILTSEKAGKAAVYTVNGQLVKVVAISEGDNFIALPAGQFVINGSVVIIK